MINAVVPMHLMRTKTHDSYDLNKNRKIDSFGNA